MISNPPQADYVEPTFKKFMHSVNLECLEQLGLDVDDLADINFYTHYQGLSKIPSWAEWDGAVNDAMQDLKEENGVDW